LSNLPSQGGERGIKEKGSQCHGVCIVRGGPTFLHGRRKGKEKRKRRVVRMEG